MNSKTSRHTLPRMPLPLAIAGVMTLWMACNTARAEQGEPPSALHCGTGLFSCDAAPWPSYGALGGPSVLSGTWGNGAGISIAEGGPFPSSNAALIGDISIGGASNAIGSGADYAIALGDATGARATNLALGDRANAYDPSFTQSVAFSGSTVDRSHAVALGNTRVVNLAAGADDANAILVGQLRTVIEAAGGTFNADGSTSAPVFTVAGTTYGKLPDAIAALDQDASGQHVAITHLQTQFIEGAMGLVRQSGAGADITVAADNDGASVDFTGGTTARRLSGIAAGDIASASSTEAINGSQLFATQERIGRNEADVAHLTRQISEVTLGGAGLVMQDATTQNLTVAAVQDGSMVEVAGTAGDRTLAGVADGLLSADSHDAVNGAQLHAINEHVAGLDSRVDKLMADITDIHAELSTLTPVIGDGIRYDDASKARLTLGGTDGTLLTQVAAGKVIAGSMDLVNGDVFAGIRDALQAQVGDLDARADDLEGQLENVEKDIADGKIDPDFSGDAGGLPIHDVGPGLADTDAINVGQMSDQLEEALATAQRYTDSKTESFGRAIESYRKEVKERFKRQDGRINRVGAMNAASTHMAINASGASTTGGRLAVGVGAQKGIGAVALGYAKPLGSRAQVSIGGAFSGPENSAGIGFQFSL